MLAKRQKIQADLTLSKEFLPLLQDESGLEKVNILQFTKNRLDEIEKLHSSMKMSQLSSSKRVFQTLPKHLRRRAASHRPNRVPKSHRAASMAEHAALKQGNDRGKRPKNVIKRDLKALLKKRVVASDTLSPSTRRKGLWLETHLWHVKRFHMHDKWGYRLVRPIAAYFSPIFIALPMIRRRLIMTRFIERSFETVNPRS